MAKLKSTSALAVLLILMTLTGESLAALKVGFYAGKCGKHSVETIVFNVVKEKFLKDRTLTAALLRMYFHDCFVRGCDASLLLDGSGTEKTAGPNGSVRSYNVIDAVKTALESACPGVVSCADIISLATRATVVMAGGKWYNVETGRRDGLVSQASDANANLPGPTIPVSSAIQVFAAKGISKEDFVLLLGGGHTVGIVHCNFFQDRVYSFNGVSGRTDPSMNPTLVSFIKRTCPRSGSGNFVNLDQSSQNSANTVDNGFFKAIVARKGVLQIDQLIALDSSTKAIVTKYANNNSLFQSKFVEALVKLGRMGVLTGSQGQVRKSCRRRN